MLIEYCVESRQIDGGGEFTLTNATCQSCHSLRNCSQSFEICEKLAAINGYSRRSWISGLWPLNSAASSRSNA